MTSLSDLLSQALTLSGEATEGPWCATGDKPETMSFFIMQESDPSTWIAEIPADKKFAEDAAFIAFARSALPLLAKICQEQEAVILALGNSATDTFEQMLKGHWRDDTGHHVDLNAAMLDLKEAVKRAIEAQKTVAELIEGAGL